MLEPFHQTKTAMFSVRRSCLGLIASALFLGAGFSVHAAEEARDPMNAIIDTKSVKLGKRAESVVTVGEKTSLIDLTMNLSPLKIELSSGCEGFCLQVADGERVVIQLFYDFQKEQVDRIVSYDPHSVDKFGNKIGDSLAKAAGSRMICDEGETYVCRSVTGDGPAYNASTDEKCSVSKIGETEFFKIPDCVKIDGFEIDGRSIYFPRQRYSGVFHTVEEEVEEAYADCKEKPEVDSQFLSRRDINGDNVEDYVLDYSHFECGSEPSKYCGTGGCLTSIYASLEKGDPVRVWHDQLLGLKFARVKRRPAMILQLHGSICGGSGPDLCREILYWNGSQFSPAN